MSFWTAIVVIVAISVGFGTISEIIKSNNKNKGYNKTAKELETRLAQLEQQNGALHERVEVLEKIVTDERYDLNNEFRKLG